MRLNLVCIVCNYYAIRFSKGKINVITKKCFRIPDRWFTRDGPVWACSIISVQSLLLPVHLISRDTQALKGDKTGKQHLLL